MVSSHVAEGRKLLARRAYSGAKCEPSISFPYLIGAGNAGEKQAKLAARMAIWMLVSFFVVFYHTDMWFFFLSIWSRGRGHKFSHFPNQQTRALTHMVGC